MTLASTLVIDSCESFQRTEAELYYLLVCPLFDSCGPLVGIFCLHLFRHGLCFPYGFVAGFGELFVLVSRAKFPFKAPAEGIKVFSLDRFYLPQGTPLFVNIILITFSAGLYFPCLILLAFF